MVLFLLIILSGICKKMTDIFLQVFIIMQSITEIKNQRKKVSVYAMRQFKCSLGEGPKPGFHFVAPRLQVY
ncbi:MAG: hypothetical protein BGO44_10570 [Legionella sp. 39-23]|nr:MAG: hypothetical protein BGO44_10570 [Legionella sp. 39-23]